MIGAYAIILAGGNGERFWPISTPERPKQFVDLFGGKALIRHAADRLNGVISSERIIIITAQRLVSLTRKVLPMVPSANIIGEPCRRDTAAAVAVACGIVKRLGGEDAVGCILTADQLMSPVRKFQQALKDSIKAAMKSDSIVTMGIQPTYPATGFGYIELGKSTDFKTKTSFNSVVRFVEKPNEKLARRYLSMKRYLWNAGMFIWRVSVMERAFENNAADIGKLINAVANAKSISAVLKRAYPTIRAISVDFAVMEKARNILVARSEFEWDDVGSWLAIPNHFSQDKNGNTALGKITTLNTTGSIVVSDDKHRVAVVGLENVVVVHTQTATLVCAKNNLQRMKELSKIISVNCP